MIEERIGNARLICGDSREVVPTLGPIQSMATDPPFGMAFQSNYRKTKHKEIANDLDSELLLWACNLKPLHSSYIFCRWDNLAQVPKPKSLITWVKNNWSMGDLKHEHGRQTETVLFYPGPEHEWVNGRPSDVIFAPRSGNESHPTEKNRKLLQQIINWTRGTVVDPFMGTGGGGIAAHFAGREYIGIEYDYDYWQKACERIANAQTVIEIFGNSDKQEPFEIEQYESEQMFK